MWLDICTSGDGIGMERIAAGWVWIGMKFWGQVGMGMRPNGDRDRCG